MNHGEDTSCGSPEFHSLQTEWLNYEATVADDVGLEAAILLNFLRIRTARSTKKRKGERWWYGTIAEIGERFPFLSVKQLREAMGRLEKQGYIQRDKFNVMPRDKTTRYALTEKGRERSVQQIRKLRYKDAVDLQNALDAAVLFHIEYQVADANREGLAAGQRKTLKIQRKAAAEYLGISLYHLTKALQRLDEKGYIRRNGSEVGYKATDPQYLDRIIAKLRPRQQTRIHRSGPPESFPSTFEELCRSNEAALCALKPAERDQVLKDAQETARSLARRLGDYAKLSIGMRPTPESCIETIKRYLPQDLETQKWSLLLEIAARSFWTGPAGGHIDALFAKRLLFIPESHHCRRDLDTYRLRVQRFEEDRRSRLSETAQRNENAHGLNGKLAADVTRELLIVAMESGILRMEPHLTSNHVVVVRPRFTWKEETFAALAAFFEVNGWCSPAQVVELMAKGYFLGPINKPGYDPDYVIKLCVDLDELLFRFEEVLTALQLPHLLRQYKPWDKERWFRQRLQRSQERRSRETNQAPALEY